ncbi:MAG TPA: site-specific DNA-methyltransferase [Candidatus Acidoferrales bacterium]|nr:site-specific DNA-methyltransferase [Candidatus Acidoferrales bacterium]
MKACYETRLGFAVCGDSRDLLSNLDDDSVNLIITSPPFALQRQKKYGNVEQEAYTDWLTEFARLAYRKLRSDGSFVLDLGGAYLKGIPARSLYNFRILIQLCDDVGFFLAEDFYWFNPSKLPSPIEWVNKRKMRVKDAVNTVWWLSKTAWPKADVSNVLNPYSNRMKKLLADPESYYKAKLRPSGHDIGVSFAKDNGGAIPSNLLQIPNSESNGQYTKWCKTVGTEMHPARFPEALPEFFMRLLTDPSDLVVDIFAGSNTTGAVAERLGRHWRAFEERLDYVAASVFRLLPSDITESQATEAYQKILKGETLKIDTYIRQQSFTASGSH